MATAVAAKPKPGGEGVLDEAAILRIAKERVITGMQTMSRNSNAKQLAVKCVWHLLMLLMRLQQAADGMLTYTQRNHPDAAGGSPSAMQPRTTRCQPPRMRSRHSWWR